MGCAEIARYLSHHGDSCITRAAFVSTITPYIVQAEENPHGVPQGVLDIHSAALHGDRVLYFADGAIKYFGLGSTWLLPPMLSSEMEQSPEPFFRSLSQLSKTISLLYTGYNYDLSYLCNGSNLTSICALNGYREKEDL